jgi:hypothetical protein
MNSRRGFLGALLAAPLALVGASPKVRRWVFPAVPHGAKLRRYIVTADWCEGDGPGKLRVGDKFTIAGVYQDNWPAGAGSFFDKSTGAVLYSVKEIR